MKTKHAIPIELGQAFSVASARDRGVGRARLRGDDLQLPFRGVRLREALPDPETNRFEAALRREHARIEALTCRLVAGQFFSHRSAACVWGMPLPHRDDPELHLSVIAPERAPRIRGVRGHRIRADRCSPTRRDGYPVSSAATTWATLGDLPLVDLVAAGDHLVRKYRAGYRRPHAGRPPLTTIENLRELIALGRWRNMAKLHRALELIREDAWSPRESMVRLMLVHAGLPEPELNVDLFGRSGAFLACPDMTYRRYKVVVEYQGEHHRRTYAEHVERVERLRAEGWIVIQVTAALARFPERLVRRVAEALRSRGWQG